MNNYKKTINNDNRNFNLCNTRECGNKYAVCNLFCNFTITSLSEENYIKGLALEANTNVLHINPQVDVTNNKKENRKKKVYFNYNFNPSGKKRKYLLEDIFIRSPSKIVINGKRYPMEACLVFRIGTSYVVVCTPIEVALNDNEPDDLSKVYLWELLMEISDNFPAKKEKVLIENFNYNPLVFMPSNIGNNRNFMSWKDNTAANDISYIQFFNTFGALSCPRSFYNMFVKNLIDGPNDDPVINIENEIKEPSHEMNATFDVYVNRNPTIDSGNKTFKYVEVENPSVKALAFKDDVEENFSLQKMTKFPVFILFIVLFIFICLRRKKLI